jgi:hypothetical protein
VAGPEAQPGGGGSDRQVALVGSVARGESTARRVFDVRLAGLGTGAVSCRDGVSLHPAIAAADVIAPGLVVVPGLDDDLARSFAENRG